MNPVQRRQIAGRQIAGRQIAGRQIAGRQIAGRQIADLRRVIRGRAPAGSLFLGLVLLATAAGCQDKAKAKFDECVAFEAKWETVKARDACKAAVELDPNSRSGKAAAGKLTYLNEQADKIVGEEQKANAPCKVRKWVTRCMWKGKPRPTLLEGETYAQCNKDADEVRIIGMTCPECVCADRFVDPYKEEGE